MTLADKLAAMTVDEKRERLRQMIEDKAIVVGDFRLSSASRSLWSYLMEWWRQK